MPRLPSIPDMNCFTEDDEIKEYVCETLAKKLSYLLTMELDHEEIKQIMFGEIRHHLDCILEHKIRFLNFGEHNHWKNKLIKEIIQAVKCIQSGNILSSFLADFKRNAECFSGIDCQVYHKIEETQNFSKILDEIEKKLLKLHNITTSETNLFCEKRKSKLDKITETLNSSKNSVFNHNNEKINAISSSVVNIGEKQNENYYRDSFHNIARRTIFNSQMSSENRGGIQISTHIPEVYEEKKTPAVKGNVDVRCLLSRAKSNVYKSESENVHIINRKSRYLKKPSMFSQQNIRNKVNHKSKIQPEGTETKRLKPVYRPIMVDYSEYEYDTAITKSEMGYKLFSMFGDLDEKERNIIVSELYNRKMIDGEISQEKSQMFTKTTDSTKEENDDCETKDIAQIQDENIEKRKDEGKNKYQVDKDEVKNLVPKLNSIIKEDIEEENLNFTTDKHEMKVVEPSRNSMNKNHDTQPKLHDSSTQSERGYTEISNDMKDVHAEPDELATKRLESDLYSLIGGDELNDPEGTKKAIRNKIIKIISDLDKNQIMNFKSELKKANVDDIKIQQKNLLTDVKGSDHRGKTKRLESELCSIIGLDDQRNSGSMKKAIRNKIIKFISDLDENKKKELRSELINSNMEYVESAEKIIENEKNLISHIEKEKMNMVQAENNNMFMKTYQDTKGNTHKSPKSSDSATAKNEDTKMNSQIYAEKPDRKDTTKSLESDLYSIIGIGDLQDPASMKNAIRIKLTELMSDLDETKKNKIRSELLNTTVYVEGENKKMENKKEYKEMRNDIKDISKIKEEDLTKELEPDSHLIEEDKVDQRKDTKKQFRNKMMKYITNVAEDDEEHSSVKDNKRLKERFPMKRSEDLAKDKINRMESTLYSIIVIDEPKDPEVIKNTIRKKVTEFISSLDKEKMDNLRSELNNNTLKDIEDGEYAKRSDSKYETKRLESELYSIIEVDKHKDPIAMKKLIRNKVIKIIGDLDEKQMKKFRADLTTKDNPLRKKIKTKEKSNVALDAKEKLKTVENTKEKLTRYEDQDKDKTSRLESNLYSLIGKDDINDPVAMKKAIRNKVMKLISDLDECQMKKFKQELRNSNVQDSQIKNSDNKCETKRLESDLFSIIEGCDPVSMKKKIRDKIIEFIKDLDENELKKFKSDLYKTVDKNLLSNSHSSNSDHRKTEFHNKIKDTFGDLLDENEIKRLESDLYNIMVGDVKHSSEARSNNNKAITNPIDKCNNYVENWCRNLPIKGDQENAKEIKQNLARNIMQKIAEFNMNPDVFNDEELYADMLKDEIDNLLLAVQKDSELNVPNLTADLIFQIMETRQTLHDEIAGKYYKSQLKDSIHNTLPKTNNLSTERKAELALFKEELVDTFIASRFDSNTCDKHIPNMEKLSNYLHSCDYIKCLNLSSIEKNRLIHDLYNALLKVPVPRKDLMNSEFDQVRLKHILNDWMLTLPFQPEHATEKLRRYQLASVLAKELSDIVNYSDYDSQSQAEQAMDHEIGKFSKKLLLKDNADEKIPQLTKLLIYELNRMKNNQRFICDSCLKSVEAQVDFSTRNPCDMQKQFFRQKHYKTKTLRNQGTSGKSCKCVQSDNSNSYTPKTPRKFRAVIISNETPGTRASKEATPNTLFAKNTRERSSHNPSNKTSRRLPRNRISTTCQTISSCHIISPFSFLGLSKSTHSLWSCQKNSSQTFEMHKNNTTIQYDDPNSNYAVTREFNGGRYYYARSSESEESIFSLDNVNVSPRIYRSTGSQISVSRGNQTFQRCNDDIPVDPRDINVSNSFEYRSSFYPSI